tara:strand:+ start:471 stop:674 length:204 start_codon:yes stop_codon:yes gene_type:complete
MTVSKGIKHYRAGFVDTKPDLPKKQIIIFGSIIAGSSMVGFLGFVFYQQYLHNPVFHSIIQSKGIFL